MKISFTLFVVVILTLGIHGIKPGDYQNSAMADTTYTNPNGSSELALLMRDMQNFTNQAKADLKGGKPAASFPAAFNKIYTAAITEGMSKSDFFNQFADLYIMSVKNYSGSEPAKRMETYNNMVSACLACHSQHCPGPFPVIKKMVIE